MKKSSSLRWADWILRVTLAFAFILGGYDKLFVLGPDKFAAMVNVSLFLGWCATLGELGAGISIFVGGLMKNRAGDWITRLSGALISFIMVVAFFLVKIKGYDAGFMKGIEGSLDVIAFFAMGLFYAVAGNFT